MSTTSSQAPLSPAPLSKEELKRLVSDVIDSRADELVNVAQTILNNPEPGFRETKTSRLVSNSPNRFR